MKSVVKVMFSDAVCLHAPGDAVVSGYITAGGQGSRQTGDHEKPFVC